MSAARDTAVPPPVYPSKSEVPDWETSAAKKQTIFARPKLPHGKRIVVERFDRILPPQRTYLGLKRRSFLLAILVTFLCVLGLSVGLGVGLTSRSSGTESLPLPTDRARHIGDLTYYETGLGACGFTSTSEDDIVSVSHITWDAVQQGPNPNTNPLCGLMLRATRYYEEFDENRSVDLKVVDRCEGCEPTDIDTSTGVFDELAPRESGRVLVTWAWLQPVPTLAT